MERLVLTNLSQSTYPPGSRMSQTPRHLTHRLMVVSTAVLAAAAGACSWSLTYLDSGPTDTDPHPDVVVSQGDASVSDGGAGGGNTDTNQGASEAAANEASSLGDGGNLIVNPSCEDGTTDWATLGQTPLESSTAFVHTGDTTSCHSYDRVHEETSGALPSYDGPMQDITAVVVPGHQYSVSAWALWAPPNAGEGGPDDNEGGASEGSDGAPDASTDAASDASADSGTDGGGGYEQQNAYITVKETCGSSTSYVRLTSAANLPEEVWTEVNQSSSVLTVPVGCTPLDLQLYIEGPDVGLDLYVDEVTLLLVN